MAATSSLLPRLPRAVDLRRSESGEGSAMDLTVEEAAAQLGVSPRRVRQYIAEGRLKARKMAGVHIISSRSLAAFERRPPGRPARKKG